MSELSAFHDVRFPIEIGFGATGGPERRTEIVTLTSGREKRNARFAQSRRRYDVGTGLRSLSDLRDIVAFFEARRGPLHGFRFRDPFDNSSAAAEAAPAATDQPIGIGNGAALRFALTKTYGTGPEAALRPIRKPVDGTLVVAVDGVAVAPAGHWSFDDATGEVVFLNPPPNGAAITAGYAFDVPVRFDTERLEISLTAFAAGRIPAIPLVEVQL